MKKVIILLAMFFTSCLAAEPTPSEVTAVLTKYANNQKGWSALNYAIEEGDIAAALILVEHVRDFNRVDGSYSPLCRVLIRTVDKQRKLSDDERALVESLIQKGANVKWEKTGDQLPLYHAVRLDDKDIVLKLLEKGANINEGINLPIRAALYPPKYGMVKLLISKGAKIDQTDNYSPLFTAISGGDIKIMKLLLDKGANPNAIETGSNGNGTYYKTSVLDMALKLKPSHDRDAIIDLLIQYGAKVS